MVSAERDAGERSTLIENACMVPNRHWNAIMARAEAEVEVLKSTEVCPLCTLLR